MSPPTPESGLPSELEHCPSCATYTRVVACAGLRRQALAVANGDRGSRPSTREDALVCLTCGDVELIEVAHVEAAIESWAPFAGWNASKGHAVEHCPFTGAPEV